MASVALSALVTSFVAPAAEASPPNDTTPRGRLCSYSASSDPAPDADDDAMTGQVNGGPLLWDRDYWLHCHIQVDNNTHTGPVAPGGDVHGPSDPHDGDTDEDEVAVVASQVVYESPEGAQDYLCTSVSWPTATGPNWYYWTPTDDNDTPLDPSDDTPGHWSTRNTEECSAATQASTGPVIDAINDIIVGTVDPALCTALDNHSDSGSPSPSDLTYIDDDGDVFVTDDPTGPGISEARWRETLFWDCPPYVDFESDPWAPGDDGLDGGEVVDDDDNAPQPPAATSTGGGVAITMSAGDVEPTVHPWGVLAAPNLWTCTQPVYNATQPFTVTCTPQPNAVTDWVCSGSAVSVMTTSAGAQARVRMDCNADSVPEAISGTASGATAPANSSAGLGTTTVNATTFRCTVGNGAAVPGGATPNYMAQCSDPGAAGVQ